MMPNIQNDIQAVTAAEGIMGSAQLVEVPLVYRTFFLTIEPISALVGAIYAYFLPSTYLSLTAHTTIDTSQFASSVQITIEVVLAQLANLYLLFTINEAFVLRAALQTGRRSCWLDAQGRRVWSTVLLGLLIADFGHLWSVRGLGLSVYWDVAKWNAMDAGNIGFVYAGAGMRLCWLFGVGIP